MNQPQPTTGDVRIYKLRSRLKILKRDERRFELALKDETNNKAMDDFCLQGLEKIKREIAIIEKTIKE